MKKYVLSVKQSTAFASLVSDLEEGVILLEDIRDTLDNNLLWGMEATANVPEGSLVISEQELCTVRVLVPALQQLVSCLTGTLKQLENALTEDSYNRTVIEVKN